MNDQVYKVDKAEIALQNEHRASEMVSVIEQKCNLNPVSFIRANFDNKLIRERATEPNFNVLIGVLMAKICALSGIVNEIDQFSKTDILKMILSRYDGLTVEEISKAFELERYGAYEAKTEHFQLFDATYVSAVLNKYKKWKQDLKMAHNISKEKSESEKSDEEKERIVKDGIIRRFENFKSAKCIDEPCSFAFDYLYEKAILPKDLPYEALYKVAKRDVKEECSQKKALSVQEKRQIQEVLSRIEEQDNEKVLNRAKKLTLEHWFGKLIDSKTEISTLLK
jgi:hypothetical protein